MRRRGFLCPAALMPSVTPAAAPGRTFTGTRVPVGTQKPTSRETGGERGPKAPADMRGSPSTKPLLEERGPGAAEMCREAHPCLSAACSLPAAIVLPGGPALVEPRALPARVWGGRLIKVGWQLLTQVWPLPVEAVLVFQRQAMVMSKAKLRTEAF